MAHQVKIPAAGESITSASIGHWHKADGDSVMKGEALATIETDKVSTELEAEVPGTIRIVIPEGEEVAIGTVIAEIAEGDPAGSSGTESIPAPAVTPASEAVETGREIEIKVPPAGESIASATVAQWHKHDGDTVARGDVLVTLETDKVSSDLEAEEAGLLRTITAEGTEVEIGTVIGTITTGAGTAPPPAASAPASDASETERTEKSSPDLTVVPAPPVPAAPPAPDEADRTSRRRMSSLRRKIATQLVNAQQTAAILTTFNEADMSGVMRLRKRVQEDFVAKHGVKLGFMSFFVKAAVQALKEIPSVNARVDGEEIVQNHFYDIGIAVGTDKGLLVPVVRDADQKGFARIEQDILAFAQKARDGKIELADLQGGSFTISNGGIYGSLLSTPILNPPQSGILGMHTIQQRPVAVDGRVEIRPMMYLALSYDHRIVDGKEAVTFLLRVKESIENPTRLLLEL